MNQLKQQELRYVLNSDSFYQKRRHKNYPHRANYRVGKPRFTVSKIGIIHKLISINSVA
uniref:Uncharacterized protein n=1 Tax=Arsenophonus endosymbiont of Trialeurodes vaporariorum TaxID=235567 RepID=A0A3B0M1K3_9GAMM